MKRCALTETRLGWLRVLAAPGVKEMPWAKMPGRGGKVPPQRSRFDHRSLRGNLGAVSQATWRPMVNAGLIEARYGRRHWQEPDDWLFKITEEGRKVLAEQSPSID